MAVDSSELRIANPVSDTADNHRAPSAVLNRHTPHRAVMPTSRSCVVLVRIPDCYPATGD